VSHHADAAATATALPLQVPGALHLLQHSPTAAWCPQLACQAAEGGRQEQPVLLPQIQHYQASLLLNRLPTGSSLISSHSRPSSPPHLRPPVTHP
jgi:hypothetical protein